MANTTYSSLASAFFNKIKDYDFIQLDEKTANDIAISYISPACNMFQSCSQDLDDRDDIMQEFGYSLSPSNFNTLVNYMCIEYIDSNYIRTTMSLKSRLSSSDFKSLNLQQQLSKVMELRSMLKSENDQLAINKSYKDSKLFDIVTNRNKAGGH